MRFILGFAVGFCISLLFAPASGEETRRSLMQGAQELMDLPRQKAGELGSQVGRQAAESAVQAMEDSVLGKNKSA